MKEKLSNGCISIAITVIPFAMLWGSHQYVQERRIYQEQHLCAWSLAIRYPNIYRLVFEVK